MYRTIIDHLTSVLIPKLEKGDNEAMVQFVEFYEKHKDSLRQDLIAVLDTDPFWGPFIRQIPKEIQDEQNKISDALQRDAIVNGVWDPYLKNLIEQGIVYATQGVTFSSWFHLISLYRKQVGHILEREKTSNALQVRDGFNTFLDIALSGIGEAYIAEKKKIVELQNAEHEQFLYIATHDLQEPLRNITNFVQLLQKNYSEKLDEKGKSFLSHIGVSAELMRSLIRGLLDYSVIGQQRSAERADFNGLLREVTINLESSIAAKGAKITVNNLPALKVFKREVSLLFQNLISNAIKFSREGAAPEITIAAAKKDNIWEFSVSDNGIGIHKKYFEKIFVIFQRLHPSNKFEGVGIGLAHCKKIVELHEGRIWVESQPNAGATFFFTLRER